MKQKYDLICIGDVVIDAFIGLKEARVTWDKAHEHPELSMAFADKIPYDSLFIAPAVGNASNVAVGASRLGLGVAMFAAIGKDGHGREVLDVYKREGIDPGFVKINPDLPTNYHFVLTYEAERTILIKHQPYEYPDPAGLGKKSDWIYFSSIAEHTLPLHHKLAEYLARHPQVRMGFNPGTYQLRFGTEKLKNIYKHTYVLFVNREEAELVTGKKEGTPIKDLFAALHKLGPKIVAITDGPDGAYASDGVSAYFMPTYPDPKTPISRTGAGDAFATGFLCALIYGLPVHDALRWGPIESMHVVQSYGAQTGLLTKSKLTQLLKKAPKNYKPKTI